VIYCLLKVSVVEVELNTMKRLTDDVVELVKVGKCGSCLIVGPSGCGKSTAVRDIVRECGVPFAVIDCSVFSGVLSCVRVDDMILEALASLTVAVGSRIVVAFDGLEALANVSLVVAATFMERIHQTRKVAFVLGTSQSREAVPAELDFEHVIAVPPLGDNERLLVLEKLVGRKDETLSAQLRGLSIGRIREIVVRALLDLESPSTGDLIRVAAEEWPSALSEFETLTQVQTFECVAGLDKQKALLTGAVLTPLRDPSKCAKYRVSMPNGVLIYGPHGSGKTLLASALSGESKVPVVVVSGSSVVSSVVGDSEKRLATIFERARQNSPCVVFFDQIDSLVPSSLDLTETQSRVAACLASELDCCGRTNSGVLVVATVAHPSQLDASILRRMDLRVSLPGPTLNGARKLLLFGLARVASRVTHEEAERAAELCQTWSAATVAAAVNEAAMMCVRETVSSPTKEAFVTAQHLFAAIKTFTK
jgi:SpoVK/Ycf46/Vps4 family AAA+-type ATPase